MGSDKVVRLQEWGIAVLRVVTGAVFTIGAVQKLTAYQLNATAGQLTQLGSPWPSALALGVILVELLCGSALVVGLFTRLLAVPLALGMLVDVVFVHWPSDLFFESHGFESALIRLGASVALILAGSGRAALDDILFSRKGTRFLGWLR
jgi:putative oxidoreductase